MTATKTATADELVARYADDIAFVAEEEPATTVTDFTNQLRNAAENFDMAGLTAVEEAKAAANYLDDADSSTDATERAVFLKHAAKNLAYVDDMVDDYRDMV